MTLAAGFTCCFTDMLAENIQFFSKKLAVWLAFPSDSQLPWWTWAASLPICHLATRLSMQFDSTHQGFHFYFSFPIGIILTLWWGPRAAIGVFLNALLSAGLWPETTGVISPLYAIPEALAAYAAWLGFSYLRSGKAWLPDLNNLVQYFALGIISPSALFGFLSQILVAGFVAEPLDFWIGFLNLTVHRTVDVLAVATPVLVLLTPKIAAKGLVSWEKNPGDQVSAPPLNQSWIELAVLGVLLIVSRIIIDENFFFYLFGGILACIAIRFGFTTTVAAYSLTMALVFYMPDWTPGLALGILRPIPDNVDVFFRLLITGSATILAGRAVSDLVEKTQQRDKAILALEARESRLRSLLTAVPDPSFVITPDGTVDEIILPSGQRPMYPPEKMLGKNLQDFLTHEEAAVGLEVIQKALDTGETQDYVYSLQSGSGKRWFQARASAFIDQNGPRVLWLDRDITTRQRQEQQLMNIAGGLAAHTGQTLFFSLVEHLANALQVDIAFIASLDSHAVGMAKTLAVYHKGETIDNFTFALAGSPCENIIGKEMVILPDNVHTHFLEHTILTNLNIQSFAGAPLFSCSGEPLGVLVAIHSHPLPYPTETATLLPIFAARSSAELERLHTEQALVSSEAKLRSIINQYHDGVTLIENGIIVEWNPSREVMTGLNRADVLGKQFADVLMLTTPRNRRTQERKQRLITNIEYIARTGKLPERFQKLSISPGLAGDGSTRQIEEVYFPIPGEHGYLVCQVTRDVTSRVEAEQKLLQRAAELEAVDRISTVLRSVSTLDQLAPAVLKEILDIMQTSTGALLIFRENPNSDHVLETQGWMKQIPSHYFNPTDGLLTRVLISGNPYSSPDFATDKHVSEMLRYRFPKNWGGIILPVRVQEEIVGALAIATQQPRTIKSEDASLLGTLLELTGMAVQRIRLDSKTAKSLKRLAALHEIDTTISASMDLRVTLEVILEHVLIQLQADTATIMLVDYGSNTIEVAASRGFRMLRGRRSVQQLGSSMAKVAISSHHLTSIAALELEDVNPERTNLLRQEDITSGYAYPLVIKGQAVGAMEVFYRRSHTPDDEWTNIIETMANQAALAIENIRLFENLQRSNLELNMAYDETIEGWSRALDLRDEETENHTQRVTIACLKLAETLGVTAAEKSRIRHGALLHDIGKMGVPDAILQKTGPLTDEEWKIMRQHPRYAYDILSPIAYLRDALDIPYCHHEWWNGEGYPQRLKGEQIPLAARIFAIVDVWDALRSDRPYRQAWTLDQTRRYIHGLSGKQFDPQVAEAFMEILGDLEANRDL